MTNETPLTAINDGPSLQGQPRVMPGIGPAAHSDMRYGWDYERPLNDPAIAEIWCASMRFGKSGNEILVDEVAPMRHGRAGDFRTYGPTLAVDRLLFEGGKWTLQPVENP